MYYLDAFKKTNQQNNNVLIQRGVNSAQGDPPGRGQHLPVQVRCSVSGSMSRPISQPVALPVGSEVRESLRGLRLTTSLGFPMAGGHK